MQRTQRSFAKNIKEHTERNKTQKINKPHSKKFSPRNHMFFTTVDLFMVGLLWNLVELFLLAYSIYVYEDLTVALFFTELKPVN